MSRFFLAPFLFVFFLFGPTAAQAQDALRIVFTANSLANFAPCPS